MYATPTEIETTIFSRLPTALEHTGEPSVWAKYTRPGKFISSFLEGPSFDRNGNLYCCDVAYGRVFRISPKGGWELVLSYDGEPNGLKLHKDGRIFIADNAHGIKVLDPGGGKVEDLVLRSGFEKFNGCNDLFFGPNGDLYFTDPGTSSLSSRTGRVWRLAHNGTLECLLHDVPYPNGLVMSPDGTTLLIAITAANAIWRSAPPRGSLPSWSAALFIQLSGGGAGPDGIALDEEGNLAIAHAQNGCVWLFSRFGEPLYRIRSCTGRSVTNVAYGGDDGRTLYITEAESGSILMARLPTRGNRLFSHMD